MYKECPFGLYYLIRNRRVILKIYLKIHHWKGKQTLLLAELILQLWDNAFQLLELTLSWLQFFVWQLLLLLWMKVSGWRSLEKEEEEKKHTSQFQKRYSETGEMVKEEGRSGAWGGLFTLLPSKLSSLLLERETNPTRTRRASGDDKRMSRTKRRRCRPLMAPASFPIRDCLNKVLK